MSWSKSQLVGRVQGVMWIFVLVVSFLALVVFIGVRLASAPPHDDPGTADPHDQPVTNGPEAEH